MNDRLSAGALGSAIVLLATVVVVARAAGAAAPAPARAVTPGEQADLALNIAVNEPEWQRASEEQFPEDHWSARDDFHSREAARVRELARERGITYEDVLRAVDEDLHAGGGGGTGGGQGTGEARSARAIPCKPRPFYD